METRGELAKAIIEVMKEAGGIEKNTTVGEGRNAYKGVTDKDVKILMNNLLPKNGLCILPIGVEETVDVDTWTEQTQYGEKRKKSVFTKVVCKYLLLHTSGESQVVTGYGHGADTQDKSAGKATTYALKNLLLYLFLIPTGEIDDADAHHSDTMPIPPDAKLIEAIKIMNSSNTLEELKANWSQVKAYQKNKTVIAAKDARKAELTKTK